MRFDPEHVRVCAAEQVGAQPHEPGRVVQLVAVDAEHPRRRARVLREQPVRGRRVPRAANVEVLEVARERLENLPRAIARDVVDRVDPIAELGDVPDRLLDEQVLVPHEDAADN